MNTIELFCGAGGTSLGFRQAGFDVRLGLDIDATVVKTYEKNFPKAVALNSPVESVTGKDLLARAQVRKLDVLLGGPSCQGYSTMGRRIEDDPRNSLFIHYVRLVSEIKPKWIVFENVRGMLLYSKGRFLNELVKRLADEGYSCCYGTLNTADYGVPQRRERFFLIGTSLNLVPTMPESTHQDPRCASCSKPDGSKRIRVRAGGMEATWFEQLPCPRCGGSGFEPSSMLRLKPWVSVWDAIGDLKCIGDGGGTWDYQPYQSPPQSAYQKLMRETAKSYNLHIAKPVSPLAREIICRVQEGKGLRSVPTEDLPERFLKMRKISNGDFRRDCTTLYHRLSRKLPSYTVTCSFTNVASGAFVHPLSDRAITPREAARLQSFPDSFEFYPSKLKMQIGNAVPPLMGYVLGQHILEMERLHQRRRGSPKNPTQTARPQQEALPILH